MDDNTKPHRAASLHDPLCDKDHGMEIYERLKAGGMVPSVALQMMMDLCCGIPVVDEEPEAE